MTTNSDTDEQEIFELPDVFRRTSAGGVQVYASRVVGDKILRWTWTKPAPKLNKKGEVVAPKSEPKKRAKAPLVLEGKWVGNTNEKTPHEAAIVKAKNEWKKKIDKGYAQQEPELEPVPYAAPKKREKGAPKEKKVPARALLELKTPMLLQKYGLNENPLPESACVSVKRNGVCGFYRVLTDDIVSRKDNQPYRHFDHLKPALARLCELAEESLLSAGYEPRGDDHHSAERIVKAVHMELDLPDELGLSFQAKTKVLRAQKTRHALNDRVIACVFDFGDQGVVPFRDRYAALVRAYERLSEDGESEGIQLVRCYTVDSDASMLRSLELAGVDDAFATWLDESYDGHAVEWEPEPPLSAAQISEWLAGELELTREQRVRLLHRWIVDGVGEEGTVIRDLDGMYWGNDYRSAAVLKHKDFEDEEAAVVGFEQAGGEHAGAVVYVLRSLENGVEYTCVFAETMGMGIDERREMYQRCVAGEVPLGRVYTVRYQERFDSGIPQFPVIVGECALESKTIRGRSLEELAAEAVLAHQAEATEAAARPKKGRSKKRGSAAVAGAEADGDGVEASVEGDDEA
jgi:hypothetical protein